MGYVPGEQSDVALREYRANLSVLRGNTIFLGRVSGRVPFVEFDA